MSSGSAKWLARANDRLKRGEIVAHVTGRKLNIREGRREDVAGKTAESLANLEEKRSKLKNASPRKTMLIGGAGGHEGGSPSPQAKRYVEERVSSEHASPVRRRPAEEYGYGIRGEVVRTTGMSSEVTDKPRPANRPNTAGKQPNPMSGHGGRYVPQETMTNNATPNPRTALPPRSPYSGKSGYKEGGIVKAKRVGKPSAWISHVKAYQKQHGVSYREAMVQAKATYQK